MLRLRDNGVTLVDLRLLFKVGDIVYCNSDIVSSCEQRKAEVLAVTKYTVTVRIKAEPIFCTSRAYWNESFTYFDIVVKDSVRPCSCKGDAA